MSNSNTALPMAIVPDGTEPAAFFGSFAGKLTAQWESPEGLIVDVTDEDSFGNIFAPLKSAMRFLPGGQPLDDGGSSIASLALETWPETWLALREQMTAEIPSQTLFRNVDPDKVRLAIEPIYAGQGGTPDDVDQFMDGNGLLLIQAGNLVGAAGLFPTTINPATPNRVTIGLTNAEGIPVNPVQFFNETAGRQAIDATLHPLVSQLETSGWVEVLVTDQSGNPLANDPYQLYLHDGTVRNGSTDAAGRVFETGIPDGGWWIDFPNHPSIEFADQGTS